MTAACKPLGVDARMTKTLPVLIAVAWVAVIGAASAQQPAAPTDAPQSQGGWVNPVKACRADISTLCKDVSGLAARLQCLKSNQDKLSPDCIASIRSVLGAVQAKAAAAAASGNAPRPLKACQQDLAAVCPDLAKGEGGRIKCLRDNRAKLSAICAEALDEARDRLKSTYQACEADRTRLCAAAGSKRADQMACLKERQAELTGECRTFVAAARGAAAKAKTAAGSGGPAAVAAPPAGPAGPAPPPASQPATPAPAQPKG